MTFLASAYGLTLLSDLPLPELRPALEPFTTGAGLVVHLQDPASHVPASEFEAAGTVRVEHVEAYLAWPDVGRFRLCAGREVFVEPADGVSSATLRSYLLGPVLAIALHQRGFIMLHCSAVEVPDTSGRPGAVAFLGCSGEGKSSLAAAFHSQGYRVVADDYLPIPPPDSNRLGVTRPEVKEAATVTEDTWPIVFPGFPALRLWPRTVQALGGDPQSLPLLHPASYATAEKSPEAEGAGALRRVRHVADEFADGTLPLRGLYVLDSDLQPGTAVEVRSLSPAQALPHLTQNIYFTEGPGSPMTTQQFLCCGALANHLPVRLLRRPRDLARLSEAVQAVLQDQSR